jgi:hypothetical protein
MRVEEEKFPLNTEKAAFEQFLKFYHVTFYSGFNFTIFVFKNLFAVVYLHTIWTFTLKGRSSVASGLTNYNSMDPQVGSENSFQV